MTTQVEKENRIETVMRLIEANLPDKIIVREMMHVYHDIRSRQTIYNYIHEAHAQMAASDDGPTPTEYGISPDEQIAYLDHKRHLACMREEYDKAAKIEQIITSIARRTGAGRPCGERL